MEDRAKYMPLMHQKFASLKSQYPEALKQIQQREKFYLDLVYTLMTKNRFLQQQLRKAKQQINTIMSQSKTQKRQIAKVSQFEQNETSQKQPIHKNIKQQKQRTYNNIDEQAEKKGMNPKPTIISNQTQRTSNYHSQRNVAQINKQDFNSRRNMYLQQKPNLSQKLIKQNSQNFNLNPQLKEDSNFKKFKEEMIKNLQPQYIKKVSFQQQNKLDKRQLNQSRRSSNNSKSQARLSCQKYLCTKPASDISNNSQKPHLIYNIVRRP